MQRAQDVERTQLQWLFLGGIVLVAGIVVEFGGGSTSGGWRSVSAACPVAIGIGMLRHGLFDIELTLNRTLVFGLLTGFVVAAYVLAVYVVDASPRALAGACWWWRSRPAAAAARTGCRRSWTGGLFGHRHNPYAVVAHVGRGSPRPRNRSTACSGCVDGLREALPAAVRRRSPAPASVSRPARPGTGAGSWV